MDKFIQDGQDPKVVEKIYKKINDMLTHGEAINYIAIQKKPAVTLLPDSITISNKRIFLCEFTKLGLATNFEIFSWTDIKDIAFKEEIFGSKVTVIPFTGENLSIDYIPKVQARKLYQLIKEALENGKNIAVEEEKIIPVVPPVATPKAETKVPSINDMYKQWAGDKAESETVPKPTSYNESSVEEGVLPFKDAIAVDVNVSEAMISDLKSSDQPTQASIPSVNQSQGEDDDELTLKLKKLKSLYDKQLITRTEYESKKTELLSQL